VIKARTLFFRSLASPAVWAWALLATVPPDALATWRGWAMVDPPYVFVSLAWWPVDSLARLAILAWLLKTAAPGFPLRRPLTALLPAINAEAFLSVRVGVVSLLGLLPALTFLALGGLETPALRLTLLGLGLLGLLPALIYFIHRSLAFAGLLREALTGPEALAWSQARLKDRLVSFLVIALPWWAFSLVLEGLNLVLGFEDSQPLQGLVWLISTPSLIATLLPIAIFVASDETP
jgi:hypothetical protein